LAFQKSIDDDVLAIPALVGKILEQARSSRQRVGKVTVSLNPFVPKPWTPFQWDPMEDSRATKRKVAMVRSELGRLGADLDAESPREAYFQTLVSRGDRRVGAILRGWMRRNATHPANLERVEADSARGGIRAWLAAKSDSYVTRRYGYDEFCLGFYRPSYSQVVSVVGARQGSP